MNTPFFKTSLPLLLLSLLFLSAVPARADETSDLASRIQKRYQAIDSLAAIYTRTSRFVSLGAQSGRDVQGTGTLVWARPLKLRLEQATPRHELIITGEGMAWWVRPERKRADLYPLNRFTGGLTSLLDALGGLARLDQDFKVAVASPARASSIPAGSLVVSLTPKVARADLKELVLWFQPEDLLLRGFAIYNLVGDVTLYSLDEVKTNVKPPASDFAFEPPVDYQVANHLPLSQGKQGR